MDVGTWLRGLGLGQYEQAFHDNAVDAEILPKLTADDLKEMGIVAVGHRRKLLEAVAALQKATSAAQAAARGFQASAGYGLSSAAPQAERRQLTVMFYDLVGSTALAARHDPEDVRETIGAFHRCVQQAITRFGGFLARTMGDGALVYFGYPEAHEDDAERAVRAGLAVGQAVAGLELLDGHRPQVRIGIATGLVVIGDIIGTGKTPEEDVAGETPNLAARLQASAEPNGVVIAASTHRLLGNLFECTDLGERQLKGFAAPVRTWQVLRENTAESRFAALHTAAPLTPLVGREEEMELLLRRWRQAARGEGQVVLISGEPGIGKSRTVAALLERIGSNPHLSVFYQCSSQYVGSALHPIISQFEHEAGFQREDSPGVRLDKLETLLKRRGREQISAAPVLAALLGIATDDRYPGLNLTAQQRKEKTFEILVDYLVNLGTGEPLLLIFEDLHWIDPTSLEFLCRFVEQAPSARVLVILTARPNFTPPWMSKGHTMTLSIDRLDYHQSAELVQRVSGKALPDEVLEQIISGADGVPLFIEELTRTILESGLLKVEGGQYALCGPLPARGIPMTLRDSLMARLDRLGMAREVAQIAACLGREFTYDLLEAVAARDQAVLRTALDQLVAADLIRQDGTLPTATYAFRHVLIQEAAYGSLLRSRRKDLHARIAKAVEERFRDIAVMRPEWLAHHYGVAGVVRHAAEHWLQAAHRAKDAHADREAASHLRACLEMMDEQRPEAGEHAHRLDEHRRTALVMLGDLASRAGDLPQANEHYEGALRLAYDPDTRLQIENRLHRPRTVLRDGASIAYYEHGGGPDTLVFVAPLAYGLAVFQPIVERLCQDFRIVTVDSRGVGASDPIIRPYPLSEHAKDVQAVIEALGGGPVIGVGLSRGSNLLFKLARAEPHLFAKLITIGGFPGLVSPPLFSEEYLRLCKALFDQGDLEAIVRVHTSFVFSEPATRELQELFVRNRLQLPYETMLSFFDPDPTIDVTPILREITVPVLVTHGGADQMISREAAEIIAAQVPDAKIYFFEGKGHLPLFTATDEFCAVLRGFVRSATSTEDRHD
jgi:class 3 adenylate cyclase/pimeloyl-ACP methyl ester carboxylesterase